MAMMKLLRICRSILRELKLTSSASEGREQWRYIGSAVRLGRTSEGGVPLQQRGEKLLSSYHTYLQSSRLHRVSLNALSCDLVRENGQCVSMYYRNCWRTIRVKVKGQSKTPLDLWDCPFRRMRMEQRLQKMEQKPNTLHLKFYHTFMYRYHFISLMTVYIMTAVSHT